jgi:AraC-like DNA-binding protein
MVAEKSVQPDESSDYLVLDLTRIPKEKALKTWLVYHGISGKQLAKRLGVSPSTVTRLLNGTQPIGRVREKLLRLGLPKELLVRDR